MKRFLNLVVYILAIHVCWSQDCFAWYFSSHFIIS